MIKRIFIDVESTGTDTVRCGMHQLSGCIDIDGVIVETFDFHIRPFEGCLFVEEALEVCHVTLEDLLENPIYQPEAEVYIEFKVMISRWLNQFDPKDKGFFIGYNSNFDKDMMLSFFKRNEDLFFFALIWGNHIDIMTMATEELLEERPEMTDFKLNTVTKELGFILEEEKLHNSQYDIEISRNVYYELRNRKSKRTEKDGTR